MADLAIIIVNWNTRQLTLNALEALYQDLNEHCSVETRVVVVDNASEDDSVSAIREAYPQVEVVESDTNLGFGGGNNLGLEHLGFGKQIPIDQLPNAVWLLNSDTLTQPGATQRLYRTLIDNPNAGVVGSRLSYGDGTFQHSAFAFPGLTQLWIDLLPFPNRLYYTRWNGRYAQALYFSGEPFPVDVVLGASMMLRREVIQGTGMFDRQFFMYAEEVDWCWRIKKAGWQIYCEPRSHIVHLEGQSTKLVKPRSVQNLWKSRLLLFKKHYGLPKRLLAVGIMRLGFWRKIRKLEEQYENQEISLENRDALIQAYQQVL